MADSSFPPPSSLSTNRRNSVFSAAPSSAAAASEAGGGSAGRSGNAGARNPRKTNAAHRDERVLRSRIGFLRRAAPDEQDYSSVGWTAPPGDGVRRRRGGRARR